MIESAPGASVGPGDRCGYFGAAQGVLLIGMLGIAFTDSLQRINAVKNVLAGLVNGVAAVVFIALTHIDWKVAGLIAADRCSWARSGRLSGAARRARSA